LIHAKILVLEQIAINLDAFFMPLSPEPETSEVAKPNL
jgi:hypothetical protein